MHTYFWSLFVSPSSEQTFNTFWSWSWYNSFCPYSMKLFRREYWTVATHRDVWRESLSIERQFESLRCCIQDNSIYLLLPAALRWNASRNRTLYASCPVSLIHQNCVKRTAFFFTPGHSVSAVVTESYLSGRRGGKGASTQAVDFK